MSTELTPAPEADIRERVAKATEGPWYVVQNDLVGGVAVANVNKPCSEIDYENTSERSLLDLVLYEADARFAAHARDDIPALLAALDAERARADAALEALELLVDCQNGPPLIKYEKDWNEAMVKADAVLNRGPARTALEPRT